MSTQKLTIGLFGFGVVGEGIYNVLSRQPELGIKTKRIVVKNPAKQRAAPEELISTDPDVILNNPEIDVVVELIDDPRKAFEIAAEAIKKGKSVVSANKKMIAEKLVELVELSRKYNVSFLYEGAVCGSVPIIRNLEESFQNERIRSVEGIVNGSTNYILAKMGKEQLSYEEALQEAQNSGFAESNPELDVEGWDAAYKLSILSLHSFGKRIEAGDILRKGITSLHPYDFQYAEDHGWVIKLIARSALDKDGELRSASILPTFIDKKDTLSLVDDEYNGVVVGGTTADRQFLYGKGAGRYPTASAVLSDLAALKKTYRYSYGKGIQELRSSFDVCGKVYLSYPSDAALDLSVFQEIDERNTKNGRSYAVGKACYSELKERLLWYDKAISVVAFTS